MRTPAQLPDIAPQVASGTELSIPIQVLLLVNMSTHRQIR